MQGIHHTLTVAAIAACVAAFGCGAVMAQSAGVPNPAEPSAATGPGSPAEPSAATPGLEGRASVKPGASRMATQTFIDEAVYANRAEIAAARYAIAHTQSDLVKQFAQTMLHDHTQANDQLTTIAMAHGYTTPLGVSQHDRADMARLEQNRGQQFNAAYSQAQDRAHREAVAIFRRAEQDARIAPAVREFARSTLPALEDHLRMANQLVASQAAGNRSSG
jgi:putative membrane protein